MGNYSMDTKEFWQKRDEDLEDEIASNLKRLSTPQGKLEALKHQLAIADSSVMRENGLINQEKIANLNAQIEALESQIKIESENAFLSEWTKEVTQSRRQEWNRRVTSGEFNAKPKLPTVVQINLAQKAQGWSLDDLKKAIAYWA